MDKYERCECGAQLRGVLCPMQPNGDSSRAWVERCDDCKVYPTDARAALVLKEAGLCEGVGMDLPAGSDRPHVYVWGLRPRRSNSGGDRLS